MNKIIKRLDQISFKRIIWILAVCETLHNLEEAIWLPGWSRTAGIWHPSVGAFEFRFAVIVITLIFYGLIYYFSVSKSGFSNYIISAVLGVILANVFIPHLFAAILTGRYAPGVITGVLLNIPVTLYLLRRGLKEGFFTIKTIIISMAAGTAVALPLLLLLFGVGRVIGMGKW